MRERGARPWNIELEVSGRLSRQLERPFRPVCQDESHHVGAYMISAKPSEMVVGNGMTVPRGYCAVKELNLVNLRPWHFLSDEEFDGLFAGLSKRYPNRMVIPFARREDNDDVACFIVRDPEQGAGEIIIIHDFASVGYEVCGRIQVFWDWFRLAVDEMIEWHQMGVEG
jgi:hypothetical protein